MNKNRQFLKRIVLINFKFNKNPPSSEVLLRCDFANTFDKFILKRNVINTFVKIILNPKNYLHW